MKKELVKREYIENGTINWYRIGDKRSAKKLFDKGETLYLLPNKVRFRNRWISPYPIDKIIEPNNNFEAILNGFEIHNCCNQLGKYASFYIKELVMYNKYTSQDATRDNEKVTATPKARPLSINK